MLVEQLKIEVKVYLRQPMYLLFSLCMPIFSFVFFGMMYGNVEYDGMSYFANYIPGFSVIILFACFKTCLLNQAFPSPRIA